MLKNISEGGILTIREVAEYLKVTERTVYRLAAAKKVPGFKVGGMWRFRQADIGAWIAAQSEKPEGETSAIKYYELRNRSVLVLCPKKLADTGAKHRIERHLFIRQ